MIIASARLSVAFWLELQLWL